MGYFQNVIYAHRPWMSRNSIQPDPLQDPGADHARMMCIESACAIAKLLELYEYHYSLRRVSIQAVGITCSAALLLIFASVTQYDLGGGYESDRHLSTCLRALDEFTVSWDSAKRARDFLLLLQRQWELQSGSARRPRSSSAIASGVVPKSMTDLQTPEEPFDTIQASLGLSEAWPNSSALGMGAFTGLETGLDLDWVYSGDIYGQSQGLFNGQY
jgi:hypothetical protein